MSATLGRWGWVFDFDFWFYARARFGFFVLALASAICFWFSSVAPVRGGTYFSLPPQRKVGKRKRLTPPAFDVFPRAPNVPTLHRPVPWLVPVASASTQRLTRFEYPYMSQRQRMVCAAQVANCV